MERKPGMKPLSHPWAPMARKTSRLAMLLAASILSSCCPPSHAQKGLKVTVEPANPIQGQSVTFTPEFVAQSVHSCYWYKEERLAISKTQGSVFSKGHSGNDHGPAYNRRMVLNSRCILQITNVQLTDAGMYKVQIEGTRVQDAGTANLEVIDPTKITTTSPAITKNNPANVKEEGSSPESATQIAFPATTLQNPPNMEGKRSSSGSAIWITMCLVLILVLAATIVYFVFRVRRLRKLMMPAETAPLEYENLPSSKQDKLQSSNEANNIYQCNASANIPLDTGQWDFGKSTLNPSCLGIMVNMTS